MKMTIEEENNVSKQLTNCLIFLSSFDETFEKKRDLYINTLKKIRDEKGEITEEDAKKSIKPLIKYCNDLQKTSENFNKVFKKFSKIMIDAAVENGNKNKKR